MAAVCDAHGAIDVASLPSHGPERSARVRELVSWALHRTPPSEPFYLVDFGALEERIRLFRTELPNVTPMYAMKCNPSPALVAFVAASGAGFDCASAGEISAALKVVSDPASHVLYANPCKPPSHIRAARAAGVAFTTADNVAELEKLAQLWPDACILLRIRTDDAAATCQFSSKFGAPLATLPALMATARTLGLDLAGVSFHVGSGQRDAAAFARAAVDAVGVLTALAAAGFRPRMLDLGGGFSGANDGSDGPTFSEVAAALRPVLARLPPGVRCVAEPGRYFAAPTHILSVNVYATRSLPKSASRPIPTAGAAPIPHRSASPGVGHEGPTSVEEEPGSVSQVQSSPGPESPMFSSPSLDGECVATFPVAAPAPHGDDDVEVQYYVNDGVYGAFNCLFFDHVVIGPADVLPLREPAPGTPVVTSTIFGPTCDALDCILARAPLPKFSVGEWLIFDKFGAYTAAAASAFNGFLTTTIVYINSSPTLAAARRLAGLPPPVAVEPQPVAAGDLADWGHGAFAAAAVARADDAPHHCRDAAAFPWPSVFGPVAAGMSAAEAATAAQVAWDRIQAAPVAAALHPPTQPRRAPGLAAAATLMRGCAVVGEGKGRVSGAGKAVDADCATSVAGSRISLLPPPTPPHSLAAVSAAAATAAFPTPSTPAPALA